MSTVIPWTMLCVLCVISLIFAGLLYALIKPNKRSVRILLPCGTLCLVWLTYAKFGGMQALYDQRLVDYKQQQAKVMLQQFGSKELLIQRLKDKLVQHPNAARGWYLLGRLHMSSGHLKEAETAFAKALTQKPHSLRYKLHWLQVRFELQGKRVSQEEQDKLLAIIKRQPKQPDALAMLAMNAYRQKHFQEAIAYWQTLLETLPPDSEASMAIRQAIAKAQRTGQKNGS